MKLNETAGPPLQLLESGPRAGASDLQAASWQREMERAQVQDWFHPALPNPPDTDAEKTSRDDQHASAERSSAPRGSVRPAVPIAGSVHFQPHGVASSAALEATLRATTASFAVREPVHATPPRTLSEVSVHGSSPAASDSASRAPGAGRVEGQLADSAKASRSARTVRHDGALPVRIHVEGDAGHATVWIGLDAAARDDLALIGESLGRWLLDAGYGSSTWICNGRPMRAPAAAAGAAAQTDHPTTTPVRGDLQ